MTGLAQNPGNGKPEILVDLELHADFSTATGTPEEGAAHPDSHTGAFLSHTLERAAPPRRKTG